MPARPRISVIICAYNAQKYIAATVESVLAQTYRDFELVVVDDGSTDDTGAIVRSYEARGSIVYHRQSNAGFGAARNKALALARGEWIAIIDHDDVCLPGRLEIQMRAAEKNPGAAMIFSNSEHFRDDGSIVRRQFDIVDPCGLDLGAGRAAELLLTLGCFIDSETAFFRKDEAAAVGGFSTSYRYVNDYDFFLKIAAHRALCALPEVLARWRVHEGQLTHTARDTIVREHIALLRQWRDHPVIGDQARRVISLRLMAYLLQAAASPRLCREFGLGRLLREAMGLLPEAWTERRWMLNRAKRKLLLKNVRGESS